jgi:Phage integrase family
MLSPQPLALLRLWWKEGKRRSVMLPHGWLFPGRSATEPISTRQINRAIHEAAEAAGIRKRVSPPTLRHSFATHLLEQDVDIRVIQVLLGHSKLDTTALYARVATKTIRSVTSPLERLALLMQSMAARTWLSEREADLLPVGYFHVVFTLPTEVADIAVQNKAIVYDLLFRAASETMMMIAADPKHLGAHIGITPRPRPLPKRRFVRRSSRTATCLEPARHPPPPARI